jgi:DNA-binding IclR family transcriptional regulator
VADVLEVLEHWAAGRALRPMAVSLGLDRNTVRKYITPMREAGFGPTRRHQLRAGRRSLRGSVHYSARLGETERRGASWRLGMRS